MLAVQMAPTRAAAVKLGQKMAACNLIHHVCMDHDFKVSIQDYSILLVKVTTSLCARAGQIFILSLQRKENVCDQFWPSNVRNTLREKVNTYAQYAPQEPMWGALFVKIWKPDLRRSRLLLLFTCVFLCKCVVAVSKGGDIRLLMVAFQQKRKCAPLVSSRTAGGVSSNGDRSGSNLP